MKNKFIYVAVTILYLSLFVESCKSNAIITLLTDNDTKFWKEKQSNNYPQYLSFSKLDMKCKEYDPEFGELYIGLERQASRGYFFQIDGNRIIRNYEYGDEETTIEDTIEILSLSKKRFIFDQYRFGEVRRYQYKRVEKKDKFRDQKVDKEYILEDDYQLFQGTPVWELAKAVQDCNTREIKRLVRKHKVPINYQEPKYGKTVLMFAVMDNNPGVVETLLSLGADPNIYEDSLTTGGYNSVCLASQWRVGSTKILNLLLKYGGDPNSKNRTAFNYKSSALVEAAGFSLKRVKSLIEAGANVNMRTPCGDALESALFSKRMDILLYLLENGADYRPRVNLNDKDIDKNSDILSLLRECIFPLDSEEYQYKLKVISFLQERGLNYWETPIHDDIKKE